MNIICFISSSKQLKNCAISGRFMKYSKAGSREQEIFSFVPSFEWLRPGDRVGLKKTNDSRVLVYYNSEQLEIAFENVPDVSFLYKF